MADISVKMGVTGLSTFKSGMNQAKESVKTLDAELKLNAERYKASGDAETYMANKTKILQQQIKEQEKVVKNAKDALAEMTRNGIDPASTAYQKMQQQLLNAETTLTGMQNNLKGVGTTAKTAATDANTLTTNLKQIGKQVNYDGVINGLGKITDGIEKAATNVAKFATNLWNTMRDAASWADDQQTLAQMYGLDTETLQRMQKTADIIDTPVEAIVKGQQRLKNNLVYGDKEFQQVLRTLKVGIKEGGNWIQNNYTSLKLRDATDIYWDLGEALMNYGDEIERDAMAQKIFGRSWMELRPMFAAGREEYEKTMESWSVVSDENVQALGDLDDSLQTLENEFETLKLTVLSELAPAIKTVSDALTGILKEVNAYLSTDEGKEKLKALGDSVAELFSDLTSMDTGEIVKKVGDALDSIKSVLDWVVKNKDGIVKAVEAIATAWVAMKVAETAATVGKAWSGLKGLFGKGGGATPTTSALPDTSGTGYMPTPTTGGSRQAAPQKPVRDAGGATPSQNTSSTPTQTNNAAGPRTAPPRSVKDAGGKTSSNTPQDPNWKMNPADSGGKTFTQKAAGGTGVGLAAFMKDLGLFVLEEAAVVAAAVVPAGLTQASIDQKLVEKSEEAAKTAEEAATKLGDEYDGDIARLRKIITATEPTRGESGEYSKGLFGQYYWNPGDDMGAILAGLGDPKNRGQLYADIRKYGAAGGVLGWDPWTMLQRYWGEYTEPTYYGSEFPWKHGEYAGEKRVDNPLDPSEVNELLVYLRDMYVKKIEDQMKTLDGGEEGTDIGAAAQQAADDIAESAGNAATAFDNLAAKINAIEINLPQFANGLNYVPYDGYIAALHKGERVVPANQNRSYNVYNNTYFDRTTVSGGVDADGLAARIATAQRRALSAVGS